MIKNKKILGKEPYMCVIGEACKINQFYVEESKERTVYPTVNLVGQDTPREARGYLVKEILKIFGTRGPLLTVQQQYETLFLHKKSRRVLMHLKPDRLFGYVNDYLDVRVARHVPLQKMFTWESFKRYIEPHPYYILFDDDEVDLPKENIPRIISEAPGPVFVSTRKRDLSLFEGATAVIISEKDLKNATSTVSNLIVTLGSDGASYNEKIYPVTEKYYTGDNLGCRETFMAIFSYTFVWTEDIEYSITLANRAASFVAKETGYPDLNKNLTFFIDLKKEIISKSSY